MDTVSFVICIARPFPDQDEKPMNMIARAPQLQSGLRPGETSISRGHIMNRPRDLCIKFLSDLLY
jgi:hypothetical protein